MITGTVALALAMGGTAYAAIPSTTTGVISGCYQTLLGNLRIIDTRRASDATSSRNNSTGTRPARAAPKATLAR